MAIDGLSWEDTSTIFLLQSPGSLPRWCEGAGAFPPGTSSGCHASKRQKGLDDSA